MIELQFRRDRVVQPRERWREDNAAGAEPSYMYAGALADVADLIPISLAPSTGEFAIGGQVWPGLSKLIEEAAEVGQVAGKIIGACGATIHFDGSNLRDRLSEELGDVLAAIDFVIAKNELPAGPIQRRRYTKRATFEAWHEGRDDARIAHS